MPRDIVTWKLVSDPVEAGGTGCERIHTRQNKGDRSLQATTQVGTGWDSEETVGRQSVGGACKGGRQGHMGSHGIFLFLVPVPICMQPIGQLRCIATGEWDGSPDGPPCIQTGGYCGPFYFDQVSIAQAYYLEVASTETLKYSGLSHLTE